MIDWVGPTAVLGLLKKNKRKISSSVEIEPHSLTVQPDIHTSDKAVLPQQQVKLFIKIRSWRTHFILIRHGHVGLSKY
jgi:hypothetical protein